MYFLHPQKIFQVNDGSHFHAVVKIHLIKPSEQGLRIESLIGTFYINHHPQIIISYQSLSCTCCYTGLYLITMHPTLVTKRLFLRKQDNLAFGRTSSFLPSTVHLSVCFGAENGQHGESKRLTPPAVGSCSWHQGTCFPVFITNNNMAEFSHCPTVISKLCIAVSLAAKTLPNNPRSQCSGLGSMGSSVPELTAVGGRDIRVTAVPAPASSRAKSSKGLLPFTA